MAFHIVAILCITCSETHTFHMPVLMHYTSKLTAEQDMVVLKQTVDYIQKLTGMRMSKLVGMSQDQDTWRQLWSCALTHNHPTREREIVWLMLTCYIIECYVT